MLLMPRWAGDVDLRPLCRALRECGIDASQIPRIAERLSRPSLMLRAAWRTGRKGRPADIDFALAAYLIALLCEATGRRFPLSHGRGPMWRALIEALALAQVFLARRYGPPFLKCSCKRDLFRDRFSGQCVDMQGKTTGHGCTEADVVRKHSPGIRRIIQRVRVEIPDAELISASANWLRLERKKKTKLSW